MNENLSTRINPEVDCKGCGKCCERYTMFYSNENDPSQNSEVPRLMALKGFGKRMHIEGDVAHEGIWLVINIPCKHLTPEKRCAIYSDPNRPLLCRKYPHLGLTDCPKARS